MPPSLLVLGTSNRGKVAELRELLKPARLTLATLADDPHAIAVDETGDSFAANAVLKAVEQAKHLGKWVLGEDSGIAVDSLKGAPGIYSARYAGPAATDLANNNKLLEELADLPLDKRSAYYECQLALADPTGTVRLQAGARCHGRIRHEPSGMAGFGYDPLFEIVEYHRTFGELGLSVKAVLSHRARAVEAFLPKLLALIAAGEWS